MWLPQDGNPLMLAKDQQIWKRKLTRNVLTIPEFSPAHGPVQTSNTAQKKNHSIIFYGLAWSRCLWHPTPTEHESTEKVSGRLFSLEIRVNTSF